MSTKKTHKRLTIQDIARSKQPIWWGRGRDIREVLPRTRKGAKR